MVDRALAWLHEDVSSNRTDLRDDSEAIGPRTALWLELRCLDDDAGFADQPRRATPPAPATPPP